MNKSANDVCPASANDYRGRYVFVAGLHRTGTSLIETLLAAHSEIGSIQTSPAPENEGCYLQGGIPHTALHGIPGIFATDPAQRHTESSQYNQLQTRLRMESDWARWFPPGGFWRVEKSPVNLIRMRLYQQLFPMAQFIIVLRHPEAMAAALAKWTDISASELIDYALDAYDIVENDLQYLHAKLVIRYEDLVADAEDTLNRMARFLALSPEPMPLSIKDGNADYPRCTPLSPTQSKRGEKWGYEAGLKTTRWDPLFSHPLRNVYDAVTGVQNHCDTYGE